jgi:uncharacterized protein (DUF302 family)
MNRLVNLVNYYSTDIVKYVNTLRSFRTNAVAVNKRAALAIAPYATAALALFFGTLYIAKTLSGRVRQKPQDLPLAVRLTNLFSAKTGMQKMTVQLDPYEVLICFNPNGVVDCPLSIPHARSKCSSHSISLMVKKQGQDTNLTDEELSQFTAGPLQQIISQIPDTYKGKYTLVFKKQNVPTSEEVLKLFSAKNEIQRKVFELDSYEVLICFNPNGAVDCRLDKHTFVPKLPILLVVKKKGQHKKLSMNELLKLKAGHLQQIISHIPNLYKDKYELATTKADLWTAKAWHIK